MFSLVEGVPEGGEGAGELYGTEIWIVNSFDGYWVVAQEFIDYAITPVVVRLTVEGNEISFAMPSTSEYSGCSYQGRVTEGGFDGVRTCTFANGEPTSENVQLNRQQTYWQTN